MNRIEPLLLFLSSSTFVLGITLPLVQVDRLYFLTTSPSLVEIVSELWRRGDLAIAVITAAFSIVFPVAKLIVLHFAAFRSHGPSFAIPSWFKALARWSLFWTKV